MIGKKTIIPLVILVVCLLAAVLIFFRLQNSSIFQPSLPTLPGPTLPPLTARLSEISGVVTVKQPDQDAFYGAVEGVTLKLNSVIKTAAESHCRLDLSNGTLLRVNENTLFTFQNELATDQGLYDRFYLAIGQVWIILNGGALEVETPSGLAAVRGSYMSVSYIPESKLTTITCLEGRCVLQNQGGRVELVAGQSANIQNASLPPLIERMNASTVDDWIWHNPEATLVVVPLTSTVQALPTLTPGPSITPPPTRTPTVPVGAPPPSPLPLTPTPTLKIPGSPLPTATATFVRHYPIQATATSQPPQVNTATLTFTPTPTFTSTPTETPTIPPTATFTPTSTPDPCGAVTEISLSECNALVALYNSTDGSSWTNKTGWLATSTPCSWYGVTCTGAHITILDLSYNNLVGTIPTEIGNLTSIQYLSLHDNSLSGSIPASIGNLTQMTILQFEMNALSGSLPAEIGNLTTLSSLSLASNQLSGPLPATVTNLTAITFIRLGGGSNTLDSATTDLTIRNFLTSKDPNWTAAS